MVFKLGTLCKVTSKIDVGYCTYTFSFCNVALETSNDDDDDKVFSIQT